ncbi:MAG TPA: AAA family ATPase [Candidatus Limnocylindria bacterium]|nr:AAA family ATPase [Candidatus Limnocylindria bacterium]
MFLFTDLRDYTRFVEAHGDVAAARLLRDYRTIVRREVARTDGAEIKTEGDSFYIVFESAVPALDCAVAILEQVEVHNRRYPERPLRIGAGIHAGDTVAYDDQYVGGAVIVASRLSSKAAAGELLVSDTARGLVRTGHAHRLIDRGSVTLKGVSESIHVWSVAFGAAATGTADVVPLAPPAADLSRRTAPEQLVCPVLVGRATEMDDVRSILSETALGHGGLIFVSGDPGVGKSAFARETARAAQASGYGTLSGASVQWESGLPYAPFLAALRSGYRGEDLRGVIERLAPDLAQLLPELGRAPSAVDSPLERHRIARAFIELLQGLGRQAPLLVVLEDLHWVDEASIALLRQLAPELRPVPVALLVTYRSDEVQRRHPLSALTRELVRTGMARSIALRPLSRGETDQLIEATLRGVPLEPEMREAIYARSEGNALFTEELLKSLAESGALVRRSDAGWERGERTELRLPETLRELVVARLERLPPSAHATLAAASVIGAAFRYDTLRAVRAVAETDLTGDLRLAVDEQLLVERRETPDAGFAFRHALTREVIYDELLLPERQRLHLLVADALSEAGAPPAIVAEHLSAGGDRAGASRAYEAAGAADLAVNAATEAIAHFEAAIRSSDRPTVSHLLGLARAYLASDHVKARSAAERGLALLPANDDSASRIDLMHIAGQARRLMGDAAGDLELARSAVELVEQRDDSAVKAKAFEWYASALATRGDTVEARAWAERARAVASAALARATAAGALLTIASCEASVSPTSALVLVDEAAAIARGARAAETIARAHASGIGYALQVEPERRRFIRIERAAEFARRYGYGATQIAAYRAFHTFASGAWPADGTFGVVGDAAADTNVAWVRALEALVAASRTGPTSQGTALLLGLADRAVRQDDPQWAVPALSYAALAQAWAGADDDCRATALLMRTVAERMSLGDRSLTLLCRGFSSAAAVLLLARQRARLAAMRDALAGFDGHAGEGDLLDACVRALDGTAVDEPLAASAAKLGERGMGLTSAVVLWAIRRVRPDLRPAEPVLTAAVRTLDRAGAAWLASGLGAREAP